MKTFKEKLRELNEWGYARAKDRRKLPCGTEYGLDGSPRTQQAKKDGAEYRRRLRALYAEYNMQEAS